MASIQEYATKSREERYARLERTADELTAVIEGQSQEALTKRPDAKNWAAVEVICHLRDAEEGFAARFQMFLAMDDPKLLMADTDRIAIDRQYIRCDAGEAIEAFRARRRETLDIFRALTPEQWPRGGIHPQHGRLTFENFLAIIAWHDDNHLDQIERALAGQV